MPPSSSRRVGLRSRRDPDPQQQSDADTPDSIATPSRKRRRVGNSPDVALRGPHSHPQLNGNEQSAPDTAQRTRITESVASNDSNATLPNGIDPDGPMDPVERQNYIINHLRTPQNYTPNAAIDYANDLQLRNMAGDNVAAFAKIAAREWCFFVQKTRCLIGRADATARPNPPVSSQSINGLPDSDLPNEWGVDIDLGPERQVSRVHAEINYDPAQTTWYITVNSRNGLKLDDQNLAKGQTAALHSGICIGIMGTQMVFLLANEEDKFHNMLMRQINNDRVHESEDEGNPPSRTLPHAHPSGPTPKREQYNPFPSTSSRNHQASQGYNNPLTSTPGRPHPGTPMAFRSTEKEPRSKGSPSVYPRGMLLDSTEDIDYSKDSAKELKPPHSYAQLIGQAIMSSPEEMLTLANIYDHIKTRYAFFRHTNAGWQNSIRHNLSLNKSFEKVARRTDEPGKGMKWKIVDSEREEFVKKQLLNPRKGGGPIRMDTSGPSSPAIGYQNQSKEYREQPLHASERLQGALERDVFHKQESDGRIKSPPRSTTPPLSSVPMANESYTPERGPRSFKQSPVYREQDRFATPAKRLVYHETEGAAQPAFAKTENPSRGLESSPGVDPVKPNVSGLRGAAAHSPPTLYSDAPGTNANGPQDARGMHAALVTPLVSRHAPRLAPPSTAQVPSQYMNFSSPAPFWKYIDLPSTPARPLQDFSPIKMRGGGEENPEEGSAQPSSPPLLGDEEPSTEPVEKEEDDNKMDEEEDVGPESPSRTLSRPASRHVMATQHPRSRSASNVNGFEPRTATGGMVRGASLGSFEEDPDEESFDLSK